MFESFSRGWQITKASFKVLKSDKEILALPLMSGALLVLVTLSILGVGLFTLPLGALAAGDPAAQYLGLAFLFAIYLASYFIIIFFNAAVVECAMIRFNGGDPVLKDGLRKAWSRKTRILQWALVAATVGLILKMLESAARRAENDLVRMVGQIGVWIAGAAWNIAVFFVVPVLVYENVGPMDALKSSARTWKGMWGEGFAASFSASIIFLGLGLLGLIPMWIAFQIGGAGALALIAATVLYWVLLAAANSAVDTIVVAALYKYSRDRRLPEQFQDALPTPAGGRIAPWA
ncbi:MAG TPA: DUF6159 family protein [Candidatus Thermoplasmatota archaeon]|nr:DUF6159 family protein [Candidatus Thermoplasmatota archaeon]